MREMKDSGISWIGTMPSTWQTGRIKDVIGVLTDYTANGSFGDLAKNVTYLDYEDYARLVRLTDLREDLQNAGIYVDEEAYEYLGKSKLFGGEILVANVGAYAGLFCEMPQPDMPATLGPNMYLIRTNNVMEAHYLYYLGNISMVQEQLKQKAISSAQPKLNKTDVKTVYISIPSVSEQHAISTFLDAKCSEIDALTADIQSQIDTLEQYKRSVITEAVTKGLDKNAEMKESGLQWVGKMPAHWDIERIGSVYTLRTEKVSDEDYPPLSVTMRGIVPQLETAAKTNDHDNRKLVKEGDFVINSRSDRRGSCGISEYDGSVSLINTVLKPNEEMNPDYYNWLFHTPIFADEFYKWGHGIVDDLWTTGWEDMKKIYIPQPPLVEQALIAEYLDKKCKLVDEIISKKQEQLTTLDSYKKSTIYEYVTGKKEVPSNE